jgi:hypothetical protein
MIEKMMMLNLIQRKIVIIDKGCMAVYDPNHK